MKLSTLDRILVAMDGPRRPSNFAVIFHFRAAPDTELLRTGARSARLKYPVTGSTINGRGKDWQPLPSPVKEIALLPPSNSPQRDIEQFLDSPFDPFRAPPIHQALAEDAASGQAMLATRAHHAAGDGASLALWLRHQFRVVAGTEAPAPCPAPAEPVVLRRHPAPVRKSPFGLPGPSPVLWTARSRAGTKRRWLTIELSGPIDAAALAACALETMVEWNRIHGAPFDGLSLWMPVNIRRRGERGFGNGTSRIRVYARPGSGNSFTERRRDVERQIYWSLRHGEWAVPEHPWLTRLPPVIGNVLVRLYLNRPWIDMGSVVFSHVEDWSGRDDPAFEDVEKIELVGQLHERHPLAINGVRRGGKTWLTFTYDPDRLTPTDIEQLAGLFRKLAGQTEQGRTGHSLRSSSLSLGERVAKGRVRESVRSNLQIRASCNDALRAVIAVSIYVLGAGCAAVQRFKIATFFHAQSALRRRYRIDPDTPVRSYGPEIEAEIRRAASQCRGAPRWAETSGSTAAPKRILYTKRRLRSARWAFIDHFTRLCFADPARRSSLYVFRPLGGDHSLTSMLVEEQQRLPSYLAMLQAPYRIEVHPAIQALAQRYGATAVRLWILALANPGALYCTNPSTLWLFLHELDSDWDRSRRLIADFRAAPESFEPAIYGIASRLDSAGSVGRFARIAAAEAPLPLSVCAPAVRTVVCWTGGYVKPFLDRLAAILHPGRYRIVPMYSMSTETIETSSCFRRGDVAFLPLAPCVLYEFIEEGLPDCSENLRPCDELEPMKAYAMVVSDPFGLRRYQTEDVFLCHGFVGRLPDLRFLRRRDLEYSFTGEKVSSLQVARVFARLREDPAWDLPADAFLTCVPSHPSNDAVPHYRIVVIGGTANAIARDAIARQCDCFLREENPEYRGKRASGRLGAPRLSRLSLAEFIARFSAAGSASGADGQFKFLPLYRRTWESAVGES